MPSDLERAVRWSKRFEAALERRYGARGRGLHEKIDSVRADLDSDTVRALRLVATVRNKIVHEEGYDRIDRKREFQAACRAADRAISGRGRKRAVLLIAGLVLVAVVIAAAVLSGRTPLSIP